MAETSPLAIAASGLKAQSVRLRHVAENIANADTPGYRRKLVAFEPDRDFGRDTGRVVAGDVRLDHGPLPRIYDPSHPLADAQGFYDGSGVDLVIEMADSREATRSYEANLKMFEQSRQMTGSLLEILRR